jgi:thioredoxin-related protein
MITHQLRSIPALVLLVLFGTSPSTPQAPSGKTDGQKKAVTLEWMNLEKAVAKAADQKKPILLDVYTDWCGWCKKMDKEVFVEASVAGVLTSKFALAKVNGESTESFTFKGQKTDGVGIARGFGVRGYPSIIFLDSNGDMLTMIPGYLDAEQFLPVVMFIGDGEYEKMEWADFLAKYNKAKKPSAGSK